MGNVGGGGGGGKEMGGRSCIPEERRLSEEKHFQLRKIFVSTEVDKLCSSGHER